MLLRLKPVNAKSPVSQRHCISHGRQVRLMVSQRVDAASVVFMLGREHSADHSTARVISVVIAGSDSSTLATCAGPPRPRSPRSTPVQADKPTMPIVRATLTPRTVGTLDRSWLYEDFPHWLKARLRRAPRPGHALRASPVGPRTAGGASRRPRAPHRYALSGYPAQGTTTRRGTRSSRNAPPHLHVFLTVSSAGDDGGPHVAGYPKPQLHPHNVAGLSHPCARLPYPHRSGPTPSGPLSTSMRNPAEVGSR